MKKIILWIILSLPYLRIWSQELFVNSEPASNMAARALGLRMNQEIKPTNANTAYRLNPELMAGLSSRLMIHFNTYLSSIYQNDLKWEGFSVYGKYRLISEDSRQSHFRVSTYGRISYSQDPPNFNEINLQGDNSGWLGGLVITQLLHKLALSTSLDYDHSFQNGDNQMAYTLSGGYLVFPHQYTSYKQTNMNIYLELLGKSSLEGLGNYLDIAPSIQFIFNSKTRLDFSYETPIEGNLSRYSGKTFLIRLEYNLFNAF